MVFLCLKFKMAPTMHQLPDAPPEISIIFLVDGMMVIGADFLISYNNQLLTLILTCRSDNLTKSGLLRSYSKIAE